MLSQSIRAATAVILLGAAGAQANDKIVLGTNWIAQAEHGGYYQALADGLYNAYGLDVVIKPGGPQVNTAQLLFGGALDIALFASDFMSVNALKQDAPYVAVAALFQKDPQMLMAHKEMGFKTLADLKGRPIQISTDAVDTYWKFLRVKYGFVDEQIRRYNYTLAPFLADKSVVQQEYFTNYKFEMKTAGFDPQVFLLADYGYSSYSSILETSKKLVAERPDVVQRFVNASIKGWYRFLHGDNSAAIKLILKDNPDYAKEWAESATQQMRDGGIVETADTAKLGIGAMTDARWKDFFDTMVAAGVYTPRDDYKSAYTLQFVNKKVESE
jgi:NitT/TauT family transport system substrate-binding protein